MTARPTRKHHPERQIAVLLISVTATAAIGLMLLATSAPV
jgi:hypothetical protein